MTHRQWRVAALAAAAAFAVAGCGGGDDGPIATRVIVFGDSLSDIGTYTPATSLAGNGTAPYFGGKFTTNTHTAYTTSSNSSTAITWAEWVATRMGVTISPAEVGFITTRVPCPAAATSSTLANSCTGYAQGGSRVTDPNGIGRSGGALTIPIVSQIASHNTRTVTGFSTGFGSGDMVFVFGGNNDVFIQFQTAAALGFSSTAVTDATAAIVTAATELANLVRNEIIARGASRVAVMTLPDAANTPSFSSYPAPAKSVLTALSAQFNTTLTTALDGSGARIIDTRALFASVYANPTSYGFTNVTSTACDPAVISVITAGRVTDGSSLFCNATTGAAFNGLRTGASATTYLFADGVHPTTGGHRVLGNWVVDQIKGFGWVPQNL